MNPFKHPQSLFWHFKIQPGAECHISLLLVQHRPVNWGFCWDRAWFAFSSSQSDMVALDLVNINPPLQPCWTENIRSQEQNALRLWGSVAETTKESRSSSCSRATPAEYWASKPTGTKISSGLSWHFCLYCAVSQQTACSLVDVQLFSSENVFDPKRSREKSYLFPSPYSEGGMRLKLENY